MQKGTKFDDVSKEDIKNIIQIGHNSWSLIQNINNWRFWIWKANSLFNLITQEPDIDKIYLYTKDPYETTHQFSIEKQEDVGTKHFNDSKAFIEYFNDMDDIYKNIEEYNPNKNHKKKLFVFDDRTADIVSSKNLNPIIIELFIRVRKLNVSFVFITQSYFALPNNIIGLFSTQYMKILLWKFQTNKNFYKLHLIIHQILTLKTLWIFTKNVLKNNIIF